MKKFVVKINVYKFSNLKWNEAKIFFAISKDDAKEIAKNFISSTEWAFDLTPIPDLRTLKEIQ